ncbi:MAG: hypothetical protein FWD82_08190, partial [Defluviitaleaceae bacterium]|nr:hypothetical protein [Defluviitaleaceae bacterium]
SYGSTAVSMKGKTDNLMDYSFGTHLAKWQWRQMNEPAILGAIFDSDEDGMWLGSDNEATRRIIEALRFGYAFNEYVRISHQRNTTRADNIRLGDNNFYNLIYVELHQTNPRDIRINPRTHDVTDFRDGSGHSRFGFGEYRRTQRRTYYSVAFGAGVRDNQLQSLRNYILCETPERWFTHIDILLLNNEIYSLRALNALPEEALAVISNNQRMVLFRRIIDARNSDFYELAVRVMDNVPRSQTNDLFSRISETNIFERFKSLMNRNMYAGFIRASTIAYYQQEGINDDDWEIRYDNVFVWRRGRLIVRNFSEIEGEIGYSLRIVGNSLEIRGVVNFGRIDFATDQVVYTETVQLYNTTVNMTDLLAIRLDSDLGSMRGGGRIVYIPAFYFDWLITERDREETMRVIEGAITIGSLFVGVGKLRSVATAGRFLFAMRTTAYVTRTTVDLIRLNGEIERALRNSEDGRRFLSVWYSFSLLYDIATFDLKNVSSSGNVFNALSIAFNTQSNFLRRNLEPEVYRELEMFIREIENNK